MDIGNPNSFIRYVAFLAVIFFVLFSLDQFFGLTYEPNEHIINTEVNKDPHGKVTEKKKNKPTEVEPAHAEKPAEIKHDEKAEEVTTQTVESHETSAEELMKQMVETYKTEVLSGISKPRKDIVVRYYRHKPDGKSAYELEKLGYYIHERPVDPKFEKYQSNAIFFGDSVAQKDIQIVAFTLLKEGLPIKVIKPSKFGDSWKSKSIEIGTDTTLISLPTLNFEAIQKFNH